MSLNTHRIKSLALLVLLPMTIRGNTRWNLGSLSVEVDTVYCMQVGPGTSQLQLYLSGTDSNGESWVNNIFYTVTDLNNPNVEMRAAKAGNSASALETVPDIGKRFSTDGSRYFAGVNADFFNMSSPYNVIGATIADGYLTNRATSGADIDSYYFYINRDGVPDLTRHVTIDTSGEISYPDGNSRKLYLNTTRNTDYTVLYTPQWKATNKPAGVTGTNIYGAEVALRPRGNKTLFGNRMELEVIAAPVSDKGNMTIPADGYVLSAHGSSKAAVETLKPGDIVRATIGFKASEVESSARELLGGFPIILLDNAIKATPSYPPHLSGPEPRTAVGYSEDRSLLYMVVVDGRQAGGSRGVTQRELAYIMKNIGCMDAMNFDGGGSSTLYVDALGVRNVPSSSSLDSRPQGQPRVVANALFAVSTAPTDYTIDHIAINHRSIHLNTGSPVKFTVYGYNSYGDIIDADIQDFTVSLPSEIGIVDGNTITPGEGQHKGRLTVTHGNLSCNVPVYLNGGGDYVEARVDEILTDTNGTSKYYSPSGLSVVKPRTGQFVIELRGTQVQKKIFH